MKNRKQTYNLLSILFLIFFYPLGLPFMWITNSFTKKTRWVITLWFIATIILGLIALILFTSGHGYEQ